MKLFVINGDVPFHADGEAGVTAVNIISYQILTNLRLLGYEITLQTVFNRLHQEGSLTAAETRQIDHLAADGLTILPPIYAGAYLRQESPFSLKRLARGLRILTCKGQVEDHYPVTCMGPLVRDRIRASGCAAILTIWSPEGVALTYGYRELPKLSYQADPDHYPVEVRLKDHKLFAGTTAHLPIKNGLLERLSLFRHRRWVKGYEKAHLKAIKEMDAVINVAARNAEFYRRNGHPHSVYSGPTWLDAGASIAPPEERGQSSNGNRRPVKIVGHAGYLNATGTTYGLRFLLVDLLPVLDRVMSGIDYEIHIIGGGKIAPALQSRLQHPRLVVRGFVEDLDRELRSSDVFFMLNNAGRYQGAYTRVMVAWSMGLCMALHGRIRESIPEVIPMENALVGETPLELAQKIRQVVTDPDLNRRIRQGGRATYEKRFAPPVIARIIDREISNLVKKEEHSLCAPIS